LLRHHKTKNINRIIDANVNRTKEGLRVCEEIARFILESRNLTSEFKRIRHKIDPAFKYFPVNTVLIKERESLSDVGRDIYINELKRKNYKDIFFANIQRVKESIRVLEEFSKLFNKNTAIKLKRIRYSIYEIEKKSAKKISALCNY
jgi:thiamine-phosphate pyrophosphorylase